MNITLIITIIAVLIIIIVIVYVKHLNVYLNTKKGVTPTILQVKQFKKTGYTLNECSYSIWFNINEWTNTNKILFQKVLIGTNQIDFMVSFGKEINTMNIFLPELNSEYKESINCKINKNKRF
jgi:hypothetical protein